MRRARMLLIQAIGMAVIVWGLAACAGGGDDGGAPPEQVTPTEEAAVGSLTVSIELEGGPYCTDTPVSGEATVENADQIVTNTLLLDGEVLWIHWDAAIQHAGGGDNHSIGDTPASENVRSLNFRTDTEEGTETIVVSVEMFVEDTATGVRTPVARGQASVTFETQQCSYEVTIHYSGTDSDEGGVITETADMERVYLVLLPNRSIYEGEDATMTVTVSRDYVGPSGECHTTEPWTGTSTVELAAEADKEADELTVYFDFQTGHGEGGVMVCTPGGGGTMVPADFEASVWGLEELEFPFEGGTQTVPVEAGLFGAPGEGDITVTVERPQ